MNLEYSVIDLIDDNLTNEDLSKIINEKLYQVIKIIEFNKEKSLGEKYE